VERWLAACESCREGCCVVKRDVEGCEGLDGILCSDELSWESKSATEDDGLDTSLVVAGGCIRDTGVIEVGGGFFAAPLGSAPPPTLSCQACDDLSCSSRALIPAGSYQLRSMSVSIC